MLLSELDVSNGRGGGGPHAARRARARARARLRAAKVLLDLARSRGDAASCADELTTIARRAAGMVHADSVGIYVRHEGGDSLELAATHAHARGELGALRIVVPLRVEAELVGLLVGFWSRPDGRPSPRAIQSLERLGARAALAIAAGRLERARSLAISRRERDRLLALLHDTATQTLFSLGLKLEMCLRTAEHQPRLRVLLDAVKKDAAMTMTHLRQLIAPAEAVGRATDAAAERLTAIIQEFRDLTGLPVLLIENAPSLPVGPGELDALAMVIQSGLANVAQDGRVARAEIRLEVTANELRFEVTGHGADAPAAARNSLAESFAAATMIDRVSAVGGWVEFLPGSAAMFRLHGALPLGTRAGAGFTPGPASVGGIGGHVGPPDNQ